MKKIDVFDLLNEGRLALSGNWSKGVLATLSFAGAYFVAYFLLYVVLLLCGIDFDSDVTTFFELPVDIFFGTPLEFGLLLMFFFFVKEAKVMEMKDVFCAFNGTYYWKSIGVNVLMVIYIFLWMLLLIVPGIVKALSYSMAPYIIAENPEMSCEEAIQRSMKMMDGHKMELFVLALCGVGLCLLSAVTLFIGLLWIMPWLSVVSAKFYFAVKADYEGVDVIVE